MINSGSALPDFGALGNENTASLGLNKPMSVISASMDKVLDDLSHNDHPHLDTIQFVTAKMYDINSMLTKNAFRLTSVSRSLREMEGIALTMKPRHLGSNNLMYQQVMIQCILLLIFNYQKEPLQIRFN
jgi:hypothetical protein